MLNHNQCKIIWNTTANSILRNECFPARVSCCAQDSMNLTLTWISGFLRFLHLIFLHLELRPVFVSLRWVQTRKPRSRLGGHVDIFLVWVFIAVVERWFYQSINNSINQLINQQINQSNLIQANQNQMKSIQSNQIKSKSNQSNQSTYQSVNPSLIHSFIHSFIHSLIHWFIHWIIPSFHWCTMFWFDAGLPCYVHTVMQVRMKEVVCQTVANSTYSNIWYWLSCLLCRQHWKMFCVKGSLQINSYWFRIGFSI